MEDAQLAKMIREGVRQILPPIVRAKRFDGHPKLSLNHPKKLLAAG
jgi:hypothetical protein